MKILFAYFIALFCAACLQLVQAQTSPASEFEKLDAAATEAVKMRVEKSESERAWDAQMREMLAELESVKTANAKLEADLAKRLAARDTFKKDTAAIAEKIKRDERALEKMSLYLDEKYLFVMKNDKAVQVLSKRGFKPDADFKSKNANEKFRTLCAILQILKAEDVKISRDDGVVSTGVFLKAEQVSDGGDGVVVLKVGNQRGAK